MSGANWRSSSSSSRLSSPRHSVQYSNVVSPKLSASSSSIAKFESKISHEASLDWDSENTVVGGSIISTLTDKAQTPKSSAVLRKEIATLEAEILHMERYLLSLYRTAFKEHLPAISNVPRNHMQYSIGSPLHVVTNQPHHNLKAHQQICGGFIHHDQSSPSHSWAARDQDSCTSTLHSASTGGQKNVGSGLRRSLADHLGASSRVNNLNTPDRLSEDIVKCVSSIYCRLANPLHSQLGSAASPTSSLSSSSIFSSNNPCDDWSPHCNEDAMIHGQLQGLKGDSGPYAAMVEVLKICLDDGSSFNYAAAMLKNFRSLVQSLEKVDPRNMNREEKLAFWINIHNALVMHAYLAYGTYNRVKSAVILKASYNVGGHCINACIIQSSILGIRSHYSEPWLQTIFSPGRKSKTGSVRHVYALEYPEPLVHFALCSGAYSDPAVRVYTAANIFQELKLAEKEFIQSKVYLHKEAKVFLPKILWYFARDMSIDMSGLIEVVSECLTEVQQKAMKKCTRGKIHFVLLINRQGKVRLSKWYSPSSQNERCKVIRELSGIILNRGPKLCNIVEWKGFRVVYRRYAGLYFCMCVDDQDNELEILDVIHHYVEILDRYFGSVCELDLIFNFHKEYYILDEILIAGELQESSKRSVIRLVCSHDSFVEVAKEHASSISNVIAQVTK